jgi:hypothetical protein
MYNAKRLAVQKDTLSSAFEEASTRLTEALKKHGIGAFISYHEVYGILDEEVTEFKAAVHNNNLEEAYSELLDVAQVALFAIASIKETRKHYRNEHTEKEKRNVL